MSLTEHQPLTITLEQAVQVIRAKELADANKLIRDFGVDNLRILHGRWGPYLADAEKMPDSPRTGIP